jgi:hypothetical protein
MGTVVDVPYIATSDLIKVIVDDHMLTSLVIDIACRTVMLWILSKAGIGAL